MELICLLVLPSYFIKKKTKKEVKGRDFSSAPAIGVLSESFVTAAITNADMKTFKVKYTIAP